MLFLALALMTVLCQDPAQASSGGGNKGGGGMDQMIPIVPMPITIIHQGKVEGILMVEFYLEARDVAEAERIQRLMPRLLDAYRTGLNEFATNEVRLNHPINLDRLELYLNRETLTVVGDKRARIIYRQVMVQNR